MRTIVVTGTGTEVGKTAVGAALAATALAWGERVAVVKPAQTGVAAGEPGDAAEVARLAPGTTQRELARHPEPLAPATAAHRAGEKGVRPGQVADAVAGLGADHDLVIVEGAGGLLVRLNGEGATIADVAARLDAPLLLVARPDLGTLNHTALTAEAARARGLAVAGVVIGSWPPDPDLAMRCNAAELGTAAGAPLLGALPQGITRLPPDEFAAAARVSLAPELDGTWEAAEFVRLHSPDPIRTATG
ncbi:dethiobiotin synthetase [Nocardiopsis mwathae]|uniref:ATP-dependent dethiobiotin synthetase BioD n=1 Tax=Nocardiopsis mwathae TaxID=1472723 RepID=A0A7W9YG78_9ACTN|nr:dethiobiotin synthase [Nocardiopsis mwathae]MBB6170711.1 dethiobiotin synthetase [Nocardiopsis mwathae]